MKLNTTKWIAALGLAMLVCGTGQLMQLIFYTLLKTE